MATGRTAAARTFEALDAVGLAVFVCYAFVVWPSLPARVPMQFRLSGPPDGWAGKGALAILPAAAVFMYLTITIVQRFPRLYNFPVPVTPANAERLYALARRLLTSVKLTTTAICGYLFWLSRAVARGRATGLPVWFLPAVVVAICWPSVTTFVRMKRC